MWVQQLVQSALASQSRLEAKQSRTLKSQRTAAMYTLMTDQLYTMYLGVALNFW